MKKDQLFAEPLATPSAFRFDKAVVAVFEDMIKRSVPGYGSIINMIGELAGRYVSPNTHCYDLGSSLGAASLAMSKGINADGCQIIGIDNSADMVNQCRELLDSVKPPVPIEVRCGDVCETQFSNASMVVLNFTLQFISVEKRQHLINDIYRALIPGGVLIVSEKICFEDAHHQELMVELYHNFKKANGYSDLEIAQKRTALENVLIPETLQQHQHRFKTAGFNNSDVWFQCFNFASMLAIK